MAVKECVEPTPYMRANHMELVKSWREAVVREENRDYGNRERRKYSMSLSQTCLGETFPGQEHAYLEEDFKKKGII